MEEKIQKYINWLESEKNSLDLRAREMEKEKKYYNQLYYDAQVSHIKLSIVMAKFFLLDQITIPDDQERDVQVSDTTGDATSTKA